MLDCQINCMFHVFKSIIIVLILQCNTRNTIRGSEIHDTIHDLITMTWSYKISREEVTMTWILWNITHLNLFVSFLKNAMSIEFSPASFSSFSIFSTCFHSVEKGNTWSFLLKVFNQHPGTKIKITKHTHTHKER